MEAVDYINREHGKGGDGPLAMYAPDDMHELDVGECRESPLYLTAQGTAITAQLAPGL